VDDLQRFPEPSHAMVERIAERLELQFVPADAEAQDEAARR